MSMSSYMNPFEADCVVELVRYIVRQGYETDEIAVLTPYTGQLLLLRKCLAEASMMVAVNERDLEDLSAMGLDDVILDDQSLSQNFIDSRSACSCCYNLGYKISMSVGWP